jgi:hypothetical protein
MMIRDPVSQIRGYLSSYRHLRAECLIVTISDPDHTEDEETILDEVVKSPFMGFLLTESEKCDFHFPYKSMACRTSH